MKWDRNCLVCGEITERGRNVIYCFAHKDQKPPRENQNDIIKEREFNNQCLHCGKVMMEWNDDYHDPYCSTYCINNLGYIEV